MEAHVPTLDVKDDWCSLFKPVTNVCAYLSIHEELLSQCYESSDIGCQEQWQHRDLLIRVGCMVIQFASERVVNILRGHKTIPYVSNMTAQSANMELTHNVGFSLKK